tara:strand:+ start:352 stop:1800 length:1449 start_codon:yes stop_codon:yes gene_type:complete
VIKERELTRVFQPIAGDANNPGLKWETVMAWAETRKTRSLVARPTSLEECQAVLGFARQHGLTVCPRGAGHSYADAILNNGEIVLDMSRMNRILTWDRENGELVVEPGVTFAQILSKVLLARWTLSACVGGMGVTVAGAVSNDVHGKDSWKVGNFGNHVLALKLLTSQGEVVTVDRNGDYELFRSVVAGLGLLGVLVEVTLQLQRVPSAFVEVTTIPVRDLNESLEVMERAKESSDFIISWVDAFANGKGLGRGTVEIARWLDVREDIDSLELERSLTVPRSIFGLFPATFTWSMVRPFFRPRMIQVANAAKYRRDQWGGRRTGKALFTDFNFMLNKIPGWKHLYRPYGYLEFQPMIPRHKGNEMLAEILNMCRTEQAQSLLCAVKSHKPSDFPLSYAGDGYSIGIDIALRGRDRQSVVRFTRRLYDYVAGQGGMAFLAKDETLPRDLFVQMYPRYQEFLQVKRRVDSRNLFVSDMYRRLLA